MGKRFLIDSNVAVDYLSNKLPAKGIALMDELAPVISVITRIEMLGRYGADSKEVKKLLPFIQKSVIFGLDEKIIIRTIIIRQQKRIKIPDAIIAATALTHNLTLLTHNKADFTSIPDLKVLDVYDM